jgi:anti-sigma regulatory factor (Ser/Thr protein kinase)
MATVVQSIGMTLPFSQTDACMLRLCAFEAAKLSITQGYDSQPGNVVNLRLDILEDSLLMTVSDTGRPGNFLDVCTPDLSAEDIVKALDAHCLGPEVIKSYMDSTEYVQMDGENRLVMSKKFKTNLGGYEE